MKDAAKQFGQPTRLDELENYRRLVELQSQVVELARRNQEAELFCRQLRQQVEVESALLRRKARQTPFRFRMEQVFKQITAFKFTAMAGWFRPVRQSNAILSRQLKGFN